MQRESCGGFHGRTRRREPGASVATGHGHGEWLCTANESVCRRGSGPGEGDLRRVPGRGVPRIGRVRRRIRAGQNERRRLRRAQQRSGRRRRPCRRRVFAGHEPAGRAARPDRGPERAWAFRDLPGPGWPCLRGAGQVRRPVPVGDAGRRAVHAAGERRVRVRRRAGRSVRRARHVPLPLLRGRSGDVRDAGRARVDLRRTCRRQVRRVRQVRGRGRRKEVLRHREEVPILSRDRQVVFRWGGVWKQGAGIAPVRVRDVRRGSYRARRDAGRLGRVGLQAFSRDDLPGRHVRGRALQDAGVRRLRDLEGRRQVRRQAVRSAEPGSGLTLAAVALLTAARSGCPPRPG